MCLGDKITRLLLTLRRRECNECTQEEKFILEEEYLKISRRGKRLRTALGNGKADIEGGEKKRRQEIIL